MKVNADPLQAAPKHLRPSKDRASKDEAGQAAVSFVPWSVVDRCWLAFNQQALGLIIAGSLFPRRLSSFSNLGIVSALSALNAYLSGEPVKLAWRGTGVLQTPMPPRPLNRSSVRRDQAR